jgi:iron complex transport system ATP-binding protein
MPDKILHTANLSVGYKDRTVLSSLNLNLNKGQLTCLLGPNGSGKSTLIRTLAGIQKPLLGMVTLQEKSLREVSPKTLAKQLSLVLTDRVTPGNLTVYELVSLGRFPYTTWMGSLTGEDKDVIQWALEITGTMQFANRHIGELSDGEKQKVMIARALAQQTDLIILDEPTAHLDSPNRIEIFHLLRELVSSGHRAILISTHDIDTAIANADKLWLVANQSISQGAPEDLVLDGRLEKAFTKEGLSFNYSLGRFEKAINNNGLKVLIKGSSLSAHWTESALRRAGFQPVEHLPQVTIEVLDNGSTRKWILNNQLEITTIEELLTKLNTYENEME